MIDIGQPNENNVVTVTASGKLTKDEYERAIPECEALFEKHDRLRFFIRLEDFAGFELGALWEDIKFYRKHSNELGRTAIVGEKTWEEWATRFSSLFYSPEVRFFYKDDETEAWEWVNG